MTTKRYMQRHPEREERERESEKMNREIWSLQWLKSCLEETFYCWLNCDLNGYSKIEADVEPFISCRFLFINKTDTPCGKRTLWKGYEYILIFFCHAVDTGPVCLKKKRGRKKLRQMLEFLFLTNFIILPELLSFIIGMMHEVCEDYWHTMWQTPFALFIDKLDFLRILGQSVLCSIKSTNS